MSLYERKDKNGKPLSPFWYCEFEDEGKPVRRSTEIRINRRTEKAFDLSRKKARQEEGLIRKEYFGQKERLLREGAWKSEITFADFTKKFLEWVAVEHKRKPNTVRYYRERVVALIRFDPLKKALISRIDEELIADYIRWRSGTTKVIAIRRKGGKVRMVDTYRPVKVATVNSDLRALRRILNVAREWKRQTRQPKIRALSGEEGSERVVSYEEECLYLDSAPDLLRDFASILIDTGLRPDSELRQLQWEQVFLNPVGSARYGYVHVARGKTKNAKRNISMTGRVRAVLERRYLDAKGPKSGFVFRRKDGSAVPYSTIDSQHDRTMASLKLHFRIYDLRHTFLTRLGESGADAFTIMKTAGHASVTMSQRYVHPTPERLESALENLEAYNRRQNAAQRRRERKLA